MKRTIILSAVLTMTVMASAQSNIEQLFSSLDAREDKSLLSKNHYEDDTDNPTTFCHYTEITMSKSAFDKLDESFFKTFSSEKDAYKIYRKTPSEANEQEINVPYGSRNEYSVVFGSHAGHNYLVDFFRDEKDSHKRHAYAIAWYAKGEDVIIMRYHIYGDDPARVSKQHVITYNGNQIIDNNGFVVTGLENLEPTVNNDIDFMKRFGTLRASFASTRLPGSELTRTAIVLKIVDLCKKHHQLLTNNERTTCDKSLVELIKNNSYNDPFIMGMLEEARIALKK
ncbi:MAG: hypothetical protein SPI27_07355 [Bacteroidaceae bacterium]|nr:hypothetical protein [Bacteroidaceae bacterium]